MTEQTTCESKDLLITYLYDEVTDAERQAAEAHLANCADCRADLDAFTGVRTALTEWDAPALGVHFRVVAEPAERKRTWPRWWTAVPMAAAAVLVLAAAAALANLEVRRDAGGVVLRTGWGRGDAVTTASQASSGSPATSTLSVASATAPEAWRTELAALEQRLLRELSKPAATSAATATPAAGATRLSDQDLLRRVQQLIDEAELRQQRNLALRMTEVSRDAAVQREADLVQIRQGLGRLEGRSEAEAARAREMMNYIVRVSQQAPRD